MALYKIFGTCKRTDLVFELSVSCTLEEVVAYLESEWKCYLEHGEVRIGLYPEFKNIKVKVTQ